MNYSTKIHSNSHLLKNILGHLEFFLSNKSKNDYLTVINYHGTPKKFEHNFIKQIDFFEENYTIISPTDLQLYYSGKLISKKPKLLITFDDGIRSNLHAIEILNKRNIKAYFFIIPAFIETTQNDQKSYFIKNIRQYINPDLYSNSEDFMAMTWENISAILQSGHFIGAHTYTHTLVASKSNEKNSYHEIVQCKQKIESNIAKSIDAFCSINNTLESVEKKEHHLIKENYQYHFTTIPGKNKSTDSKLFIKRCNIETHWMIGSVKYALGNFDLIRWKSASDKYQKIIS